MSKVDRIKEALGWLKVVFAALVAVDISLIAWLAQSFQSAENVLVVLNSSQSSSPPLPSSV